jgi:hypothetical protein
VIVHDLDVFTTSGRPTKAHTELILYPDTMLARTISFQRLKSITRRYAQIVQSGCDLELPQLASCHGRDVREPLDPFVRRKGVRISAFERLDHSRIVTRGVIIVERRITDRSACAWLAVCVRSLRGRTDKALTRHLEPTRRFETAH